MSSLSQEEARVRTDTSLLGVVRGRRHRSSAYLFREGASVRRQFAKTSPEGVYQLAICLRSHRARVEHDRREVHAGTIPVGGVNLYSPGEQIEVDTKGPWEMLVLFLDRRLMTETCDEVGLGHGTSCGGPVLQNPGFRADRILYDAAVRMAQSALSQDSFRTLRMELAAQESAIQLLSAHSDVSARVAAASYAKAGPRGLTTVQLRRAYEAMSDVSSGDLSLSMLAAAAGCSPSHFSRAFKNSTGFAPFEWLLQRRIDRAKDLLAKPNSSLSAIALEVGFAAQPQFTTAFKRVTGWTPGEWRSRLHNR